MLNIIEISGFFLISPRISNIRSYTCCNAVLLHDHFFYFGGKNYYCCKKYFTDML